jgi:hypothetical protein
VIALDVADLVVIAARALDIDTDAALDRMDIAAAQDALAAAQAATLAAGREPAAARRGRAAAATAGVRLVHALLRYPPVPGHGQRVAVAAGLQFLSLNGWRADLDPPATAAVVVEALASGRLSADDAVAWLAPRLSPARLSPARLSPARLSPARRVGRPSRVAARSGRGRPVALPAIRVPVGRAVAGALLAAGVTGASLFAAACSRGPDLPAVPSGGVPSVRTSPASGTAPADSAYAACMRSRGTQGFGDPSAHELTTIGPAAVVGLYSLQFRAAEDTCRG